MPTISKLKKKAHELWSLCVRERDGACVICGTTELGQAHHYIVSAARSLKYRYDIRNGCRLCYSHHLRGVHTEASYAFTRRIVEACIERGNVTWDDIDDITDDQTKTTDYNREDLNAIIERLKLQLAELQSGKAKPGAKTYVTHANIDPAELAIFMAKVGEPIIAEVEAEYNREPIDPLAEPELKAADPDCPDCKGIGYIDCFGAPICPCRKVKPTC